MWAGVPSCSGCGLSGIPLGAFSMITKHDPVLIPNPRDLVVVRPQQSRRVTPVTGATSFVLPAKPSAGTAMTGTHHLYLYCMCKSDASMWIIHTQPTWWFTFTTIATNVTPGSSLQMADATPSYAKRTSGNPCMPR